MGRPAVLKVDIVADAKGVGAGVAEAEGKLGKLGGAAGKVGKAMALGLAGATLAVGAFAVASVRSASDVEQSFGAVESVFGKAAAQVKGYASTAATELGLAKGQYASLAAVVGSQLQSMGASQAESAVKSRELIGVGADLAATFGGSVSDAVGAVGSLLRGERDPIEKYGIAIKAADVEARLAAQGQDKLEGAARKSAEAQATLTLLMEQSKNAHGAFGRESNTLAGQQERLRAQFENVKATVGAGLTPILTALLTFVTGKLLPGAQVLAGQLRDTLGPAFDKVGKFVTGVVMPAFASLTSSTNGPTKGALSGLATFVTGTVVPTAQKMATYFTGSVVPAFAQVATFVGQNVVPVLTTLATFVVGKVIPAAIQLAGPVLGGLRSAFASINAAVTAHRPQLAAIGTAMQAVAGVALKLAPVIGTVLGAAFKVLGGIIGGVISLIGNVVSAVQSAMSAINSLANAASKVGDVAGKLNPFSAGPALHSMAVPLVGGYGGQQPRTAGLLQAAYGTSGDVAAGLGAQAAGGGGLVVVDRRTIDARSYVEAMLLDDRAVARLERAQRDHAARMGAATSWQPA